MNPRGKKTSIVLAGAVALASGAYAVGSQSGGGTSGAATATAERFGPAGAGGEARDFGFSTLADKLGVSTSRLRNALDQIRSENGRPDIGARIDLVNALADGLSMS